MHIAPSSHPKESAASGPGVDGDDQCFSEVSCGCETLRDGASSPSSKQHTVPFLPPIDCYILILIGQFLKSI